MSLPVKLGRGIAMPTSLVLLLACATPAHAVLMRTGAGHAVSYQPTIARAAGARSLGLRKAFAAPGAATRQAVTYRPCASIESACLEYHGGAVMHTTTLTPIFWNPSGLGLNYPSKYQTEIDQFFTDLAAESGKESNFFSLLTQYYDGSGHINYAVTAGAPQNDSDPLPVAPEERCTTPFEGSSRPCVSDLGVRTELEAFIAREGLTTGIGHEYVLFLPEGIDSCFDTGGSGDPNCSGTGYCGYHGTLSVVGTVKQVEYANEPDNGDPTYGGGCSAAPGLNAGALTINTTSHEVSESVTDPEADIQALSWYDEHTATTILGEIPYAEIGDMCAWEFKQGDGGLAWANGEGLDAEGGSDETINGHPYLLQTEWDNAHSTCSLSELTAATKSVFSSSDNSSVPTGTSISFNGAASHAPQAITKYEWEWGDGASSSGISALAEHRYASTGSSPSKTFKVTLRVTDANENTGTANRTVTVEDRPPIAAFTPPSSVNAGAGASFDGSASSDPDGTIAQYSWSFGDGASATGATPAHTYATPGQYTVTLTVTDNGSKTASLSQVLTVAPAPSPPIAVVDQSTGALPVPQQGNRALPSNRVLITGSRQNRKTGSLAVSVLVPGPGLLSSRDASSAQAGRGIFAAFARALGQPVDPHALVARSKLRSARKPALVKAVSVNVSQSGTVTLEIVPTSAGRTALKRKHVLAVKVLITFAPTDGVPGTTTATLLLGMSAKSKHK